MFCMDEFFERELPNMYHYIEKISVCYLVVVVVVMCGCCCAL